MKTAISLPDETFQRVVRRAQDLGMSRSEFFARAAARYLDELDEGSVTDQINAVLDQIGAADGSNADAAAAGLRFLDDSDEEW